MDSGIGDFIRQIPTGLIGMLCLSALLLIGVTIYIFWARSKRRKAADAPATAAAAPTAPADEPPPMQEMPDLDILTTPLAADPAVTVSVSPPPSETTVSAAAADPAGAVSVTAPVSAEPERPAGAFRVHLTEGGDPLDVVEVLVVLRDTVDGGLLVRMGDKVYRNPPATADGSFKRQFNLTMKELATGKRATAETAPTPAGTPTAPPIPSAPAAVAEPTAPPSTARTGEVPPVTVPPNVPLPGDLPKFKLPDKIEVPPRRGRKAPPKEVIPEINIAVAIESFLQHKLTVTQAYPGHSIHVRPAGDGGVEIEVDGNIYEAVGDIEDAGVRAFIAATIEEWQARQ
jgi:hypothetical protein